MAKDIVINFSSIVLELTDAETAAAKQGNIKDNPKLRKKIMDKIVENIESSNLIDYAEEL